MKPIPGLPSIGRTEARPQRYVVSGEDARGVRVDLGAFEDRVPADALAAKLRRENRWFRIEQRGE